MWWLIVAICLLGIYKSYNAYWGCIKSDAVVPALNMFLLMILFLSLLGITLYVVDNYNIEKKFNIETYEQRLE